MKWPVHHQFTMMISAAVKPSFSKALFDEMACSSSVHHDDIIAKKPLDDQGVEESPWVHEQKGQ